MRGRARQTLTPHAAQAPGTPRPPAGNTPPPRRTGELVLACEHRHGKTVVTHSRCSYPWHAFPPLYLDRTGCATMFLGNPSGGLAGGDTCVMRATLGRDTHVLFTTPSATRIYRSDAHPAVQSVNVTVGPNAVLEWLPELTMPFAGSRFDQHVDVRLERGASLILRDAVAAGRIARGERWAFARFCSRVTITLPDDRILDERYMLEPDGRGCVTFDQGWNYTGSLFIVRETAPASTWERTGDALASALAACAGDVLGGVSEPPVPGLVVKVVARTAPGLGAVLDRAWSIARRHVWNAGTPDLRRY